MDTPLPSARSLLVSAWAVYRERWTTAIGCLLLPAVVYGVGQALVGVTATGAPLALGFALSLLGSLGLAVGTLATIYVLGEPSLTARQAWDRALPQTLPLVWLGIISAFFVVGGLLLFIVPGVMFAVWFSVVTLVFAREGERGMAALRRSRQLVRGRFWAVTWRLLVLLLVWLPLRLLTSSLGEPGTAGRAIGDVLAAVLLAPYVYAYLDGLYRSRAAAVEPDHQPLPATQKLAFAAMPLAGWALGAVVALLVVSIGPSQNPFDASIGALVRDAEREAAVRSVIQPVLGTYYARRGKYPSAFTLEEVGEWVTEVPTEPDGQPYAYTVTDGGYGYTVCPRFERRPLACFGPPTR